MKFQIALVKNKRKVYHWIMRTPQCSVCSLQCALFIWECWLLSNTWIYPPLPLALLPRSGSSSLPGPAALQWGGEGGMEIWVAKWVSELREWVRQWGEAGRWVIEVRWRSTVMDWLRKWVSKVSKYLADEKNNIFAHGKIHVFLPWPSLIGNALTVAPPFQEV